MKANKASRYCNCVRLHFLRLIASDRQTADTFQAAATFLDLCQIWGPLEPEIASKIKFAKYHSLRILKAIKAREDPNLSNPVPEPEEEPPLDPDDPEVRLLNGSSDQGQHRNDVHQPSVMDVPDEDDRLQQPSAQRSSYDESLHQSRAPSVSPHPPQNQPTPQESGENYYQSAVPHDISPLAPGNTSHTTSNGEGYFPVVPDAISHAPGQSLPHVPPTDPGSPPAVILPDPTSLSPPGASGFHTSRPPPSDSLHSFPPPNMEDSKTILPLPPVPKYPSALPPASTASSHTQPSATPRNLSQTPVQPPRPTPAAPARHASPTRNIASPSISSQTNYAVDEEAILKAQKHARWAISALNFEDVSTAVKELRGALESLGASTQGRA